MDYTPLEIQEKKLVEEAFKDSKKLLAILEKLPLSEFIQAISLIGKLMASQEVLGSSGRGENKRVMDVYSSLEKILE